MTELRREQRTFDGDLQIRAAETGDGFTFSGYAAVWDSTYPVYDSMGSYQETFRSGAFTRALQNRADVRLLIDHGGVPLARTASGTLSLREDSHGLFAEAQLDPSSPLVQTIRSAMQRGDLTQMSHQFAATRQKWDAQYENREVLAANLYDVSIVTFPANAATEASLRDGSGDCARAIAVFADAERQIRAGALDPITRDLLLQIIGAIDAGASAIEDAVEVLEEVAGVAPEADASDLAECDCCTAPCPCGDCAACGPVATDVSQGDSPMRSAWLRLRAEALSL